MQPNRAHIGKAQLLAWELKDDAWREVEGLPLLEAFRVRRERAEAMVEMLAGKSDRKDPRTTRPIKT